VTFYVAPIVEGHTEQHCVERLLQRVWNELLRGANRLQILQPFRGDRSSLVHVDGRALGDAVQKASLALNRRAARDPEGRSLLLILLDAELESEDDCPAKLAPRLLQTAQTSLGIGPCISCVLATRMLENWIVGGASTLAGVNGLPATLPPRDWDRARFEEIRGAKWLDEQLRGRNPRRKYKKTADAEPFV
jgi:hypothetical protein